MFVEKDYIRAPSEQTDDATEAVDLTFDIIAACNSMRASTARLFGMVFVASLALAGCMDSRGGKIPYDVPDFTAPDPAGASLVTTDVIAPLDKLSVRVFGFNELSGEYDVDLTGHIGLPLIGDVKAVDLSTQELKEELTARLGEKYIQSPDVTVGIKQTSRRVVTIDGAVNRPGQYPIAGPTTLMQALALASGVNAYDSNPRRIAVFRTIGGKRMAAAFDLTNIRRGQDEDPVIYSGDIVVVDGSKLQSTYRTFLQSLPVIGLLNTFIPL